jgi:ubiquinone/menaquinone biosynthesis C-methylase UbiE
MITGSGMRSITNWQYNEIEQVGMGYADIAEVERYDARHRRFRDVEKENNDILQDLSIQKNHVVADFGAGTGAFAIQAARRCKKVYAIDVSQAMLSFAEKKAQETDLANIVFCHQGFLTYSHESDPVDAVVSKLALHHLPDFWKAAALRNINGMMKVGSKFLLVDVVFSEENRRENISGWIAKMESIGGKELAREIEMHIREEYSTFTWIMEGLLKRAGFAIDRKEYQEGVLARYVCTKISA